MEVDGGGDDAALMPQSPPTTSILLERGATLSLFALVSLRLRAAGAARASDSLKRLAVQEVFLADEGAH
jgi:hypothetical protein